eukprot:TRINITY_DN25945_c0_g1_i1.p1 TRINITY_DN25945_c0_g1~~TRINITY_DN25945_c0_g1_i1.p1  ORF type:complete len:404 (+),score=57.72 TRINITY_DN25945_c0_g1_i1:61-1272(+)
MDRLSPTGTPSASRRFDLKALLNPTRPSSSTGAGISTGSECFLPPLNAALSNPCRPRTAERTPAVDREFAGVVPVAPSTPAEGARRPHRQSNASTQGQTQLAFEELVRDAAEAPLVPQADFRPAPPSNPSKFHRGFIRSRRPPSSNGVGDSRASTPLENVAFRDRLSPEWQNEHLLFENVGHSDPLPSNLRDSPQDNFVHTGVSRQRGRLLQALDNGAGMWRSDFAANATLEARTTLSSVASIEHVESNLDRRSPFENDNMGGDFERMREQNLNGVDDVFFTDFSDLMLDRDGFKRFDDGKKHLSPTERNMASLNARRLSSPTLQHYQGHPNCEEEEDGNWLIHFTSQARAVPIREIIGAIVGRQQVNMEDVAQNILEFVGLYSLDGVESSRVIDSRCTTYSS